MRCVVVGEQVHAQLCLDLGNPSVNNHRSSISLKNETAEITVSRCVCIEFARNVNIKEQIVHSLCLKVNTDKSVFGEDEHFALQVPHCRQNRRWITRNRCDIFHAGSSIFAAANLHCLKADSCSKDIPQGLWCSTPPMWSSEKFVKMPTSKVMPAKTAVFKSDWRCLNYHSLAAGVNHITHRFLNNVWFGLYCRFWFLRRKQHRSVPIVPVLIPACSKISATIAVVVVLPFVPVIATV